MRYAKVLFLIFGVVISAAHSQAQMMGKLQDIFTDDIFFVRLKEVHDKVQGEEGKAVPLFLEKTMKNPKAISLTDFRREKETYYALCKEYNGIIEDIIGDIQSIEKLKDLREVNLLAFSSRIGAIGPKFEAFFKDLSRYHQEAAIVGILIDIYKLGKPIIQHLIAEKVETIKHILTEQLRSLKITPLSWEAAEAVVAGDRPAGSPEEIRAKLGLSATEYYRSLNLAPGSSPADIQAAHAKLTREYADEIANTSNPEIQEFFQQLSTRVASAKRYFDANPPLPPSSKPEGSAKSVATEDCDKLKGKISGLLSASEYMTKEQLIEKLKEVVGQD